MAVHETMVDRHRFEVTFRLEGQNKAIAFCNQVGARHVTCRPAQNARVRALALSPNLVHKPRHKKQYHGSCAAARTPTRSDRLRPAGLRGQMLRAFASTELIEVIDMTAFVREQAANVGEDSLLLPRERAYRPASQAGRLRIGLG